MREGEREAGLGELGRSSARGSAGKGRKEVQRSIESAGSSRPARSRSCQAQQAPPSSLLSLPPPPSFSLLSLSFFLFLLFSFRTLSIGGLPIETCPPWKWRLGGSPASARPRILLGAWRKKSQGLTDDPRASDQPLALVVRRSNQRLHLNWSSGWVHTPRTSSLARSASPRTALKAGVDALPYSLFLFLHFVLPGSSSVSRCSRSSEEYLIPVHSGRKRPRLLPSSLQIPASEQRPFSSRRCL